MNEWKLTPRSKNGFYGSRAINNIAEMTNYHPNKTRDELEDDILDGTEALDILTKKYADIDYEKAFMRSLNLNERTRARLFEAVFKRWAQYNLFQLAKRIGVKKLIKIMTYVKDVYPNDYNNRALKRWPNLAKYI